MMNKSLARTIALLSASNSPESYTQVPNFEPHTWVINAIMSAFHAGEDTKAAELAEKAPPHGFVIANGAGTLWRIMDASGINWSPNKLNALRFARRKDAENFSAEDEDAWLIQEITEADAKVQTVSVTEKFATASGMEPAGTLGEYGG